MFFFNNKSFLPSKPSNLINRDNLIKKLGNPFDKKLTLVSAPIGFGKSTFVSEWIKRFTDEYDIAWFNIDLNDNNPIIFITSIIEVLSLNNSEFGKSTDILLKSSFNPDILISSIINEMASKLDNSIVIIDDYHLIENTLIKEYMSFFINRMPSNIHLIIISRAFPDIQLGKLRLQNYINEIDVNDLRFTISEEKEFLSKSLDFSFSDSDIQKISNKVEGWVAGLQFMSLALKNRKLDDFINDPIINNVYIEEYLADEVLSNLDEDIKQFLLKTSFLNKFNYELSNYVLEINNSDEIIKRIKNKNLFLNVLDSQKNWFRYHNLFKKVLFNKLSLDSNLLDKLKSRTLNWFENNNFIFDALNCALDLKDFRKYADLLNKISINTITKGEFSLFKTLVQNIPEKIVSEYPMLCICVGWINCLTHNLSEVEKYIEYAEKSKDKFDLYSEIDINIHIELLRSYYFTLYDQADFNYFKKCIEILLQVKHDIKDDLLRGAVERILGGMYVVTYDWEKASESFKNAKDIGRNSENYIVWITSVGMYSLLLILTGNNDKAFKLCKDTFDYIDKTYQTDNFPLLGYIFHPFGKVLYELGNYEKASYFLDKAIHFSEKIENKFLQIASILELSLIEVFEANNKKSLELLEKAEFILDNTPIYVDIFIEFNLLKLWILHNKTEKLSIFEQKYLKLKSSNNYRNPCRDLIFANILYIQGKFDQVEFLLEESISKDKNINSTILYVERMLFYSFILAKNSKFSKSSDILFETIKIAQKYGYFNTVINYYSLIGNLLEGLELRNKDEDISLFLLKIRQSIKSKEKFRSLPENLSEREIEILKLVCMGFSNQDISEKLILAIGTVKKHTNTIYSKLGVSNRISAIQKAHDLGI